MRSPIGRGEVQVRRRALRVVLSVVLLSIAACESSLVEARRPVGEAAGGSGRLDASGGRSAPSLPVGDPDAYRGLGAWIDIYDTAAWADPERAVAAMSARGVRTIYLQTSNFHRGRPFVHPEGVVRFLDAAAARDLRVVAWYLPGFRDVSVDGRRVLAAVRLRTPAGNAFDAFALDIESPEVRRPAARTARLLRLSARLRRTVGEDYPLGAVVPSPRGVRTNRSYWPSFPYRRLAGVYDVFLPMTYFTWRVSGRVGAAWYTAKNILILRQETSGMNVRIHVIGGIASDASLPETRGFADSIRAHNVIGASYYTFPLSRPGQWRALRSIG